MSSGVGWDTDMLVRAMLERLGNRQAIQNARLASVELSRGRVERDAVEIYLMRLAERTTGASDGADAAVLVR